MPKTPRSRGKSATPRRRRIVLIGRSTPKRVWAKVDGKRANVQLLKRVSSNTFEGKVVGSKTRITLRRADIY